MKNGRSAATFIAQVNEDGPMDVLNVQANTEENLTFGP